MLCYVMSWRPLAPDRLPHCLPSNPAFPCHCCAVQFPIPSRPISPLNARRRTAHGEHALRPRARPRARPLARARAAAMNIFSSLGWSVGEWWPGILLAIVGSVLNNVGTNVIKLAINARLRLAVPERPRLSAMPQWMAGFFMFVVGTALSFGAYKFAAQSLLSGLGSVQFISQVCFSRFVLHEKVERQSYVGVMLICIGCTLLVIYGAHETKNYKPEELAALYGRSEYVCYILGAGFLACAVSLAYSIVKQRIMREKGEGRFDIVHASVHQRQVLAALYSVKSALFGSQAVVLAKSLSMLLIQALHPSPSYSNPLYSYQTYFIVLGFAAAATFWVTRLNHGLRSFEAVYFIPMMQLCWIIFSTVAGGIYYEEFIGFGAKEYSAFAVGFLTVLVGVAMLCPRDDVTSFNAADVIYEIVSDENMRLHTMSPRPVARFDIMDPEAEELAEAAESGQQPSRSKQASNGIRKTRKARSDVRGYEQVGTEDSDGDDTSSRRSDVFVTIRPESLLASPSDLSVSDRVQRLQEARSRESLG